MKIALAPSLAVVVASVSACNTAAPRTASEPPTGKEPSGSSSESFGAMKQPWAQPQNGPAGSAIEYEGNRSKVESFGVMRQPWEGAGKAHEDVALAFLPSEDVGPQLGAALRALEGKRVFLAPFADGRTGDGRLIGRQTGHSGLTVTTRDDVPAWCSAHLAKLLERAGVELVPGGGDLVVSGTVRRFLVEEGDDFVGTVLLQLTVTDGAGRTVWTGQEIGTSSHRGRTYKLENYLEALSDSYLHALDAWWRDPAFTSAVGK